jgi:hypothetical protein
VNFITFEVDKHNIAVGESTNVLINVRSSEDKSIQNPRILMTVEPSCYEPSLSITNSTIEIPVFFGKCKNRRNQSFCYCHGVPCKRSSLCAEGHGFCKADPIRCERISSHYNQ